MLCTRKGQRVDPLRIKQMTPPMMRSILRNDEKVIAKINRLHQTTSEIHIYVSHLLLRCLPSHDMHNFELRENTKKLQKILLKVAIAWYSVNG